MSDLDMLDAEEVDLAEDDLAEVEEEELYDEDSDFEGDESGYWAAHEDPTSVLEALRERIQMGEEFLQNSYHYQLACRNGLYYYNQSASGEDDGFGDTMVTVRGESGEVIEFSAAYFRYLLRQQLTTVSAEKPHFDVAAMNADKAAREGARIGKQILEAYRENKDLNDELVAAAENALAHSCGGIVTIWDMDVNASFDPSKEEVTEFQGDVKTFAVEPGIDMGWDYMHQAPWEEQMWCWFDRWMPVWELVARYPDRKSLILEALESDVRGDEETQDDDSSYTANRKDQVLVRSWYHRKCNALPDGRWIDFLGNTWLDAGPNRYGGLPISMMKPARYGRDVWGWSPGFDIQSQHEMLCEILSRLATNFDSLGAKLIYVQTGASVPPPEDWGGGAPKYIRGSQPPVPIDLGTIDPAVFSTLERVLSDMERISGVTSGLQGTSGSNLRSNAQQVHQADRSSSFLSQFRSAWERLHQDVGKAILHALETFPSEKRRIQIVGRSGAAEMLDFDPGQLAMSASVTIRRGPAAMATLENRLKILEMAAQFGDKIEIDWEQLTSVIEGTPMSVLTRRQNGQVELAQEENERLMFEAKTFAHQPALYDDHMLHIAEHSAILNHQSAREDEDIASAVYAAIAQHMDIMQSPEGIKAGILLGYDGEGIALQLAQLEGAEQAVTDQERAAPQPQGAI